MPLFWVPLPWFGRICSTTKATITKGSAVSVIGESGGYYVVKYNGITAFVSKGCVTDTKPQTETTTTKNTSSKDTTTTTTKKSSATTTTTKPSSGDASSYMEKIKNTITNNVPSNIRHIVHSNI